MSILIDETTGVIVQGITGRDGSFHTAAMIEYGTRILGGVTPGKGGQQVSGVPVFDSVKEAVAKTGATASVIFVPPKFATSAIREAAEGGIRFVICITEGIPVLQMVATTAELAERGVRLLGPNCPGLISPGKSKIGIMPGRIHKPGRIGLISRSGTLTYEVVYNLTEAGLGQSTCVGIGGDPIVGTGYIDLLDLFEKDHGTDAVVLIGEIGGDDEEKAAEYIRTKMSKPVVSFISGRTAPPGKRMGHAGAIIAGGRGTAEAKVGAFREAGVPVADKPDEIPALLRDKLAAKR